MPVIDLGQGKKTKSIGAGNHFSCALLNDDSIKCWGNNGNGQLGLGDTFDRDATGDDLPEIDFGLGYFEIDVGL